MRPMMRSSSTCATPPALLRAPAALLRAPAAPALALPATGPLLIFFISPVSGSYSSSRCLGSSGFLIATRGAFAASVVSFWAGSVVVLWTAGLAAFFVHGSLAALAAGGGSGGTGGAGPAR